MWHLDQGGDPWNQPVDGLASLIWNQNSKNHVFFFQVLRCSKMGCELLDVWLGLIWQGQEWRCSNLRKVCLVVQPNRLDTPTFWIFFLNLRRISIGEIKQRLTNTGKTVRCHGGLQFDTVEESQDDCPNLPFGQQRKLKQHHWWMKSPFSGSDFVVEAANFVIVIQTWHKFT